MNQNENDSTNATYDQNYGNTGGQDQGYSQGQDQEQNQGNDGQAQGQFQGSPEQYNQWMQHYQQGNHDQVPHDQLHQQFNQFAQQVPPQQLQQATTQGYQQVPPQQRPSVASSLLNFFQQHGMSPQAAGVQNTNPQQMSPEDMARMTQYAQQQQPDALKQLFSPGGQLSNPLVGMALVGALAFGASKLFKQGR